MIGKAFRRIDNGREDELVGFFAAAVKNGGSHGP
jgi:hypothetical protein